MALSCIITEIKREIGGKSQFFDTPAFDIPSGGSWRFGLVVTRWPRST